MFVFLFFFHFTRTHAPQGTVTVTLNTAPTDFTRQIQWQITI